MSEIYEQFWSSLQKKSQQIETNIDVLEKKRTGSYYTNLSLTDAMMHELVGELLKSNKPIEENRFLEPCVGAGNFVFSYLKELKNAGINRERAIKAIDNIYVADINKEALCGYITSLRELVLYFWNITLDDAYFDKHVGGGLLLNVTASELSYIAISDIFPLDVVKGGFDVVVTNPPYKNLKAERGHYSSNDEYNKDKDKYASIARIVSGRYKYSADGVLNLYKLFVEEIVDKYANETAYISLLLPASILSDKTCTKLRTHILEDMYLKSVKIIAEGSGYIAAQQALSALLIYKGRKTKIVSVTKDFCKKPEEAAKIKIADILNANTQNAVFAVTEDEYEALQILRKHPVVKELDFIVNLRGELDLTADKRYITTQNSGFKLLRGRDIEYYALSDLARNEFVEEEFINNTKKSCYIKQERIVCQQIANMQKKRRLTFALVPPNYILGNSCNFISVLDNKYGIDIYALLGLFNTQIVNWLFKLTSSNNHVNNYEIDCFPVPIESAYLQKISELVKTYLVTKQHELIDKIEQLSRVAYGLERMDSEAGMENKSILSAYLKDIHNLAPSITYEEAEKILKGAETIKKHAQGYGKFECNVLEGITQKYQHLYRNQVLNHTTFKLSDLDLEMIKPVPQGGSWKDIPPETVEKSRRLKRITQTGGRTTLYGRLAYDKPSYTITTYFNRPGNGTYVHPVHERVLSVREAARFQTFKDDYYFFGNKTQLLKQVGNAVPTILAYQIGKAIKEKTGCCKSIDLFCGAGGMTSGFKAAGIQSLLCNDIEESACTTLKINNPEIPVLCGDITHSATKEVIEKAAKAGQAGIICGGPPCQGFSLAGFRSDNDSRNQLFREFADIVKRVNPQVIVFENVEGLLSYQGGRIYREVHTLFFELGYNTEGRTLMASDYAVPQKRKRVFIICTRNDLGVKPAELFPQPITELPENQVTVKETIYDLESVDCQNSARYLETYSSDILSFFKGQLGYDDYIKGRAETGKNSVVGVDNQIAGPSRQLALNI